MRTRLQEITLGNHQYIIMYISGTDSITFATFDYIARRVVPPHFRFVQNKLTTGWLCLLKQLSARKRKSVFLKMADHRLQNLFKIHQVLKVRWDIKLVQQQKVRSCYCLRGCLLLGLCFLLSDQSIAGLELFNSGSEVDFDTSRLVCREFVTLRRASTIPLNPFQASINDKRL